MAGAIDRACTVVAARSIRGTPLHTNKPAEFSIDKAHGRGESRAYRSNIGIRALYLLRVVGRRQDALALCSQL